MNRLEVVLTYQNVYGVEKGLNEAIELISKYPVEDAVIHISRIGIGVVSARNIKGINPIENQIQLLGKIVSPSKAHKIVAAFREWEVQDKMDERGDATIINFETQRSFFSTVQVIMAIKLALCNCKIRASDVELDKVYDDLIDSFLMINNRIGPDWDEPPNIAHILSMSQQFQILEEPNHYFHRWKILTSKILAISECEEFKMLGLREKFKSSFKLELSNYSQIGRFMYAMWELILTQYVDQGRFLMPVDLLRRMTKLTNDELERILSEFCGDPEFYRESINLEEQRNPWNNKILLQKPVVRIENKLICVDRILIALKTGEGLYYSLMNLYDDKTKEERNSRNMISSILGYAFQEYVDETFDRIFLTKEVKRIRQRFIRGDDIPKKEDGKRKVDGIIDYGTSLVIVEFKSSLLSQKAKNSCKNEGTKAWDKWLERTVYDGAEQIDQVIKQIKRGELDDILRIDHTRIDAYYPLIIMLQTLPNSVPNFMKDIEKGISEREIFSDRLHIRKLEIMHISDLEGVEVLIESGVELKKLLYTKIRESHYNDWLSFFEKFYPKVDFLGSNTEFGKERKKIMQKEMNDLFNRDEINKMRREEEDSSSEFSANA